MQKKKELGKGGYAMLCLCIIFFLSFSIRQIYTRNSTADKLETICTSKAEGTAVNGFEKSTGGSTPYMQAEFEYEGVKYTSYGKADSSVLLGEVVTVFFDADNPELNYCGAAPLRAGLFEWLMLFGETIVLIMCVKGYRNAKQ